MKLVIVNNVVPVFVVPMVYEGQNPRLGGEIWGAFERGEQPIYLCDALIDGTVLVWEAKTPADGEDAREVFDAFGVIRLELMLNMENVPA